MKKIFLIMVLAIVHIDANAQPNDFSKEDELATAYFEAFSNKNIDKMLSFYHNEITYIDETYIDPEGKTANMIGREEIKEMFTTQFFPLIHKIEFSEAERFFSGKQGVFQGTLKVHYKGTVAGKSEEETALWTAEYVTVLTFEDGKIIRQNDFVNYNGGNQTW